MTQKIVKILMELLKIKGHSREERQVADYIKRTCKRMGVSCIEDMTARKTGGNAGNLLAWPRGVRRDKATTLFVSHMDTVDVGPAVRPKKTKHRIMATGHFPIGIDNRLGAALILSLLSSRKGNYACAFTTQEEIGMFGAAAMKIPKNVKRIFVLDGSQSPGHFVAGTVGGGTFEVRLSGLSAHAGINPNGGKNAIQMAAHAISRLTLGMPGRDTSVNVGVIQGGTRTNVVPNETVVKGEVRAGTDKKIGAQLKRVKNTFARAARQYGGKMKFSHAYMFRPYAHRDDSPIVRQCAGAIRRAGLKPVWQSYRGGADSNVFNHRGIPAVNLSIGAHNPHSEKEYADIREIERAFRIVTELAAT
jgi:tripeptide aminopeptidase